MTHEFLLPRIPVDIRIARRGDLTDLDWDRHRQASESGAELLAAQNRGDALYLIAAIANHPVGHVNVTWEGVGDHRKHPEITHLDVFEALKGYGIGTALLATCEQACRDRGFTKVGLTVDPVIEPRWRVLYERLGYKYETGEPLTADPNAPDVTPAISLELVKEL